MPETNETTWTIYFILNDDCSAQDRPREQKLASLKPPRKEDSEYVCTMSANETAIKTSNLFRKRLCDEILQIFARRPCC